MLWEKTEAETKVAIVCWFSGNASRAPLVIREPSKTGGWEPCIAGFARRRALDDVANAH